VLAVLAVLAAALAPAMIRRISQANITREASNLATMADALKQQVLQQKTIPDAAGWVTLVQNELNLAPYNIKTNAVRYARAFLIDPDLTVGTTIATTLPFNQPSNGVSSLPASVRFLLVSSIYKTLPVSSGVPSAASFSNVWNTLDGGVPAGWPAEWSGKGDQLRIQRLDLGAMFRRLILNPNDPAQCGRFSIDTSLSAVVTNGTVRSSWYLDGTIVGLYDTNNVANSVFLELRELLQRDTSYVFENGLWRTQIFDGMYPQSSSSGSSSNAYQGYVDVFEGVGSQFLNTTNSLAKNGSTPTVVLSAFYTMMMDYYTWSFSGFIDTGNGYRGPKEDYGRISNLMGDLDKP
jgi:type II secretory pathway pseudopilin PulG